MKRSNSVLSRTDTLPLPKRSRSVKRKASFRRQPTANVGGANTRLAPTIANAPLTQSFRLIASPSPFPERLTRVLTWRGTPAVFTGASVGNYYRVVVNNAFDPDYDNVFGQQQPLYWDQLTSSTGPYKSYYVKKWTCVWQVLNRSTYEMEVYLDQTDNIVEDDTVAEMRVRPSVVRAILGGYNSPQNRIDMVCSGSAKQFFGTGKSMSQVTAYSAGPTNVCMQTLLWNNIAAAATYDIIITPTLTMEIEFSNADSAAS